MHRYTWTASLGASSEAFSARTLAAAFAKAPSSWWEAAKPHRRRASSAGLNLAMLPTAYRNHTEAVRKVQKLLHTMTHLRANLSEQFCIFHASPAKGFDHNGDLGGAESAEERCGRPR